MKDIIIILTSILTALYLSGCAEVITIDSSEDKTLKDSTRNVIIRRESEEFADTTRIPIVFDITIEDWDEIEIEQ